MQTYRPAATRHLSRLDRRVQCIPIIRTRLVLWAQARGRLTGRALQRLTKTNLDYQDPSLKVDPTGVEASIRRGALIIPGGVKERAAEVLFEGGNIDENSVVEVILDYLLLVGHSILFGSSVPIYDRVQAPLELQKTLISSIIIFGKTEMLPGLIPRLRQELVRTLNDRNRETEAFF